MLPSRPVRPGTVATGRVGAGSYALIGWASGPNEGELLVRTLRVLMAVSAAALVAAACGDDSTPTGSAAAPTSAAASSSAAAGGDLASQDPGEILNKAKGAITAVKTVRLKGGGTSSGQTFEVDMRYGEDGAYGTVSNSGQTIELRRVGQTVYLKADAKFWSSTAGADAAKLLGGKFLKAPLTDPRVQQLATFTDKDGFVAQVLQADGEVTKGEAKEIRGTPAIGLKSGSGTNTGTLYIATEGEPLPLQLVPDSGGGEAGSLDFLEYDEPVKVETPAAAETVDVTKLGG